MNIHTVQMLPSVASGLSPSTLGGKPVLELACISQDQPTKLSEHSGGLVMSLLTSNSPTDLDHHSPALLNNHRRSFSSDFADKTTPEALVHPSIPCTDLRVTRSPEPVADRPPDTKPSVNPSAHDLAQALFPTPSTSSGHDSSHPSPVAIEASYGFPTSTTDCDLADSSDVRPTLGRRKKSKVQSKAAKTLDVQLINDLPAATAEACKTFETLEQNWYQTKALGKTKMSEGSMVCECSWSPGEDARLACSQDSGCINYLTQIECLESECRCRHMCRNQRFQKREYALIDIVQTERKGYGIRLREDVDADTFIYEYLGEVVGEKSFQRRIKDYAQEGLKHFYFMQLQREEYIDATKKGGFGRFLNHSCNPNCYIGKWVVGRQLRMGIFTKRSVKGGEELTFNYNVDRYGYEPQECYCGEPNCMGHLGGNTQTDVGALDELSMDALGITADVEAFGLKGSKTKKGRKMDLDYIPVMKSIPLQDVPKVASAMRQSISNPRVLSKLLRRILITVDTTVQKQLMRLHGFSLMSMVLSEYLADEEIVKTTLEILLNWPLINKNKLISSNIEEVVMKLSSSPSEVIQTLAAEVVGMWVHLQVSYVIPKAKEGDDCEANKRKSEHILDHLFSKRVRRREYGQDPERPQIVSETEFVRPEAAKPINRYDIKPEHIRLPPNWAFEKTLDDKVYYYHLITRQTQWTVPTPADAAREEREWADFIARQKAAATDVNDIVAKTKAEAEAACLEAQALQLFEEAENKRLSIADPRRSSKHSHKHSSSRHRSGDYSGRASASASGSNSKNNVRHTKDKKMLRLFSTVIVRTMSRYKNSLEHDQFKKRAKELTDILCQKESKSKNYQTEDYDALTPEKEAKIKTFVKDWMVKLLARKAHSASVSSSTSQLPEASDQNGSDPGHAYVKIPDLHPKMSTSVHTTHHVPNTPVTPGSKSISEISTGEPDQSLIHELNGDTGLPTSTFQFAKRRSNSATTACRSPSNEPTLSSELGLETRINIVPSSTHGQAQVTVSAQSRPFDLAPPPPPPMVTSCLELTIAHEKPTMIRTGEVKIGPSSGLSSQRSSESTSSLDYVCQKFNPSRVPASAALEKSPISTTPVLSPSTPPRYLGRSFSATPPGSPPS